MGRRVAAVAVLAAGALAAVGCSSDGDARQETQPAPRGSTFELGAFDELPRLPRSEPLGVRSEKDGIVTQSFSTVGRTPQQVLDYYARELGEAGWESATPVHRADTGAVADWITEGFRLEVSATQIEEDHRSPQSDAYVVQYSLVLRPR